jgi:Yip1 domain
MKKILFNPFEKLSDTVLIGFGIIFNLIGLFLSFYFNVKFLGFLKIDYLQTITSLQVIEQTMILISIFSIVIFIVGKTINPKTRFIDVLNTVLIARIPFYFITFFNSKGFIFLHLNRIKLLMQTGKLNDASVFDSPLIVVFYIATFLALIWSIILLYNGFKTATNAKETKHTIYFIIGIIVAEVISRILIYHLN